MADQACRRTRSDQRMRSDSLVSAQQIVLQFASQCLYCEPLVWDVLFPCRPQKPKSTDDLIKHRTLGEVVVERGACSTLSRCAQRIHLHVFSRSGMFCAHRGLRFCQVHHLDQRIRSRRSSSAGHCLECSAGQESRRHAASMQCKGAHRAGLAIADCCRNPPTMDAGAHGGPEREKAEDALALSR